MLNERRVAQNAALTLAVLCNELDASMPLRQALAFLSVALRETPDADGRGTVEMIDVQRDTNAKSAVTSRDLLGLGKRKRSGKGGLGLIKATECDEDLRRKFYKLTPAGHRVIRRLA